MHLRARLAFVQEIYLACPQAEKQDRYVRREMCAPHDNNFEMR